MIKNLYEKYLAIFPTIIFVLFINIYYNGEIKSLSNTNSVIFTLVLCLPLFNRYIFQLKRDLLPFYLFCFISFISSLLVDSHEMQLVSLKRLFIIFLPSFLIVHNYANYPYIDKIFQKTKMYFVFFVFILCLYASLIFILDLPNLRSIIDSSHDVTITKFFNLGQIYYTRDDIFGDLNTNVWIPLSPDDSKLKITKDLIEMGYDPERLSKADIASLTEKGILTGAGHKFIYWYRPSSLISNTVGFSQLILFASIFLLDKKKIKESLFSKIILIFFILCLVWTFSRINLLIFFVLVPLLFLFIKKNKILYFYVISISIIFFIIFNFKEFYFINNLYHLNIIGNLFDRFEIYRSSLENFDKFYLHGLGFGLSNELFILSIQETLTEHNRAEEISIPSIFIVILIETGVFGLLSYILITGYSILNNKYHEFENSLYKKNLIILLIVIFSTQFFDCSIFRFHPTNFFFFIIIGILVNQKKNSTIQEI